MPYYDAEYVQSLQEFGTPLPLAGCGGWLLERPIRGTGRTDAMTCYPLFCCSRWAVVGEDLDALSSRLVSICLVTDPMADVEVAALEPAFPDLFRPYKSHYVADLMANTEFPLTSHHRRNVRAARQAVRVELVDDPGAAADEWADMYANLVARHHITGIAAFSRAALARQLQCPSVRLFRAVGGGRTVGMVVWLVDAGRAYYHLAAYTASGYASKASYALFAEAFAWLRASGIELAVLGAGAGATGSEADGLTRFKQGWANTTRTTYLCGRVYDRAEYDRLTERAGGALVSYFPAYRAGEFR